MVEAARSRLGMRVAVVGKGGAGKSLIAGTLARLLARRGRSVLAVDFDTNPGLAYSLGVPATEGVLPDEVVMEHPGAAYGWGLRNGVSPTEVVDCHSAQGPDGVRFVSLGKICNVNKDAPKRTVVALCELTADFSEPGWDVIGDLEAGPTTPFERYHAFADRALVVVTPTWVSAMTARRLLPILDDVDTQVVANQFRNESDHLGLAPVVRIPWDPAAADAERRGLAPLDVCPDSPTIAAVVALADALTHQEVTV
jgi:CO dehydrogenase maturation factor